MQQRISTLQAEWSNKEQIMASLYSAQEKSLSQAETEARNSKVAEQQTSTSYNKFKVETKESKDTFEARWLYQKQILATVDREVLAQKQKIAQAETEARESYESAQYISKLHNNLESETEERISTMQAEWETHQREIEAKLYTENRDHSRPPSWAKEMLRKQ